MVNNISFKADNYGYSKVNAHIDEVRKNAFGTSQHSALNASNSPSLTSEMFNLIPNFLKLKASIAGWSCGIFNAAWTSLLAGAAVLGVSSSMNRFYESDKGFTKAAAESLKSVPNSISSKIKNNGGFFKSFGKILTKPFTTVWKTSVGDVVKGIFVKLPKGTFNYIKTSKAGPIGKTLAVLTGVSLITYNIFHAFLDVNQKHAEIDHRYKVGHNG